MKKLLFLIPLLLLAAIPSKAQNPIVIGQPCSPAAAPGTATNGQAASCVDVGGGRYLWTGSSSGGGVVAGLIDPTQAPYNVKADAKTGNDGSLTSGANATFSSTNQNCSTADTGKLIIVVTPGTGAYPMGTGLVTVTGCSGNSWTTNGTTVGAVGSQNWGIGTDGAGLAQAYSDSLAQRKILALPCGTIIITSPPFIAPATGDWLTQHPDIAGCQATGGTGFIFHPNVMSTLNPGGGTLFAFFNFPGGASTGAITASGLGGQNKIQDVFLTSLGGALPVTAGATYHIINSFNSVNNVATQLIGFNRNDVAAVNVIVNTSGENHHARLNFQNFTVNGLVSGANAIVTGVKMGGQGQNLVQDSIFAFQDIAYAVQCLAALCAVDNSYIVQTAQGVVCISGSCTIKFIGNTCSVNGGAGSQGCLSDNGGSSTFYVFGNPVISSQVASFPAITITNAASVLDISGSKVSSTTSGFNVSGSGTLNDRAGNSWSSPLTQFAGTYVPIGGGSAATSSKTANTNFGTNIGSTNIVAAGSNVAASTYDVKIGFRQTTLGVGCGAGSNTVNGVLSWTSGGIAQSTGAGGVPALGTLTISANGATGTSSSYSSVPIHADINTAITFTTTSVLASAGCGTVPQYVVDFSNI